MSYSGAAPVNHPFQLTSRPASDDVDTRITPAEIFDPLHAAHRFTLDAAASATNARVPRFFDRSTDGLKQPWRCERVWCNPPFSALPAWVAKAWNETNPKGLGRPGADVVVMLLPANRTEQPWWQKYVEPHRDQPNGRVQTHFVRRRRSFASEANPAGKFVGSPPFGLVLVTFRPVVALP